MFSLFYVENFSGIIFLVLKCINIFLCSSERLVLLAGGSLEISDVTEYDAGTYFCIADNGNETIEAQAEITIQGMYFLYK